MISAELPCLDTEPEVYHLVSKFMLHGPCGSINTSSPCMKNNRCSKFYPKKYQTETFIDSNSFAIYKRRNNCRFVLKNNEKIDNRFVVPHNKDLICKYEAHICVEYCCEESCFILNFIDEYGEYLIEETYVEKYLMDKEQSHFIE